MLSLMRQSVVIGCRLCVVGRPRWATRVVLRLIAVPFSLDDSLPMTDPWCWYINANIKGIFLDGKCYTIYSSTMDPMGFDDSWLFFWLFLEGLVLCWVMGLPSKKPSPSQRRSLLLTPNLLQGGWRGRDSVGISHRVWNRFGSFLFPPFFCGGPFSLQIAAFWSWKLPFQLYCNMVFATFWCSNFWCWMVFCD